MALYFEKGLDILSPDKGNAQYSRFWFEQLEKPHCALAQQLENRIVSGKEKGKTS